MSEHVYRAPNSTIPRRKGFARVPLEKASPPPGGPFPSRTYQTVPLRVSSLEAAEGAVILERVKPPMRRSPAKPFPKNVAALLAERDPWCVHCGSPFGLQNHHRRLKGIGGDGRDHTQCSCNGVRLCATHHAWTHSGDGRREAEAEGLIVPRSTLEPGTVSVLVHLEDYRGGMRKWPTCDGQWLDYVPEAGAA